MRPATYKDAGVDIEKGGQFAEAIQSLMQRTFDGRVMQLPGGFAGLFSVDFDDKLWRRNYRHPVLVSSTDGVGTKVKIASMTGRHGTVGIDMVAMCVNDILVLGAEPLFLLDYIGCAELDPGVLYDVVKGVTEGCREAECALIGGETAEMPDLYAPGEYDLAGFVVGVAERHKLVTGARVRPGDSVIGLRSSGLHSNGFTLVRKLVFEHKGLGPDHSLSDYGLECTVADELLTPTRIYVRPVRAVLGYYRVKQVVHGMAHITGGGLPENIKRILPRGCKVEIHAERWERPKIFDIIQQFGDVSREEMYRTFNMGIGLVMIVAPYYAQSVMETLRRHGAEPALIGRVVRGDPGVQIL